MDDLYPDLRPLTCPRPLVAWVGHVCDVLGVTGRFDAYAEALMEMALEVTGTEEGGLRASCERGTAWVTPGPLWPVVAEMRSVNGPQGQGLGLSVTIVIAGDNKAREVKGHVPVVLDSTSGTDLPAALLRFRT